MKIISLVARLLCLEMSFLKPKARTLGLETRILCLEIRSMRLSLRLSLIFLFLLLINFLVVSLSLDFARDSEIVELSNLLLPIYGQVRADQADTLRPAADRDGTDWYDIPEAGNDWEKIDDTTPDEDATYLWLDRAGSNCNQGWIHSDFSTSNTIDSVRLTIRARSTATTGVRQIRLGRAWADAEGMYWCLFEDQTGNKLINVGTNWADSSITWNIDPCYQTSWTQNSLNDPGYFWAFQSVAVGTASDSFGKTSAANKFSLGTGYISAYRYQAIFTGRIDTLAIFYDDGNPVSNVKLGVYTDSGASPGYPYQLLDSTGVTAVTNGWNRKALVTGNISVVNGTYYWIVFRVSAPWDTTKRESGSYANCGRYKSFSYSNAWPATFPTGASGEQITYTLQAIGSWTRQNQVTQSFVVVYSHAVVGGKSGKNILSGGILK